MDTQTPQPVNFISNCTLFASTLLGSLFTRCWICSNWCIRASVRSGTDVGWWGLVFTLCSKSSQKCWVRFCYGLCAGQSSCSISDSLNLFFMDCALCSGRNYHSEIERLCKLLQQHWKLFSKMSLYTVDLSSLGIYKWLKLLITKCSHISDLVVLLTRF